ncbi:HNH endonuclease [Cohnella hongkongensis]|uniref:HNH endonuclease n=1 Tax=Cohnella hongkongensis TaxID=178337 RepID=A0ABV9FLV2_9BACL
MKPINGRTLNYAWGVGAKHALYRSDGKWYHHLRDFPGALFDMHGYLLFDSVEEYISSPHLQHGYDLHVPRGISTDPKYKQVIGSCNKDSKSFDINNEIISNKRKVSVRLRNRLFVEKIKQIYDNTCQLCGVKIEIREKSYYSEVHHIKPLGEPHFGPDVLENMMCVCPNHHVLLDLGGIPISTNSFIVAPLHNINNDYIKYHNQNIFSKT